MHIGSKNVQQSTFHTLLHELPLSMGSILLSFLKVVLHTSFLISFFMSFLKKAYVKGLTAEFETNIGILMHQSIPPAPSLPPPPGNRGAFASIVSLGGGALANLARPGDRALANPGGTPGLLTRTWLTLKRGRHGEFPR